MILGHGGSLKGKSTYFFLKASLLKSGQFFFYFGWLPFMIHTRFSFAIPILYNSMSEAGTRGIKLNLKLILESQASQLAIYSIRILLLSYCHFDILREVTKKDYLIPKLLDQA